MKVSYTKLETYKHCPVQYYYKYVENLRKKTSKRSTHIGKDIHKLIELFYTGNSWREYIKNIMTPEYEKYSDEEKQELGYNYINDLIKIMGQYEYYYQNDNMKVLDVEHKKYAPLGTFNGQEVELVYICDAIVEVKGKQYLLEHKTYSKDPMSFEDTWLNVQTALYVSELNKLGWDIKGVIWDNIKSVAPKEPNILKNGSYGKQYQNNTLFSFISTEVIMRGPEAVIEEANKYYSTAKDLEVVDNYQLFLSRHSTTFNDNVIKAVINDTTQVIEEITSPSCRYFRNMGWSSCNFCEYSDLCKMEMLGQDSSVLINTMYKVESYE